MSLNGYMQADKSVIWKCDICGHTAHTWQEKDDSGEWTIKRKTLEMGQPSHGCGSGAIVPQAKLTLGVQQQSSEDYSLEALLKDVDMNQNMEQRKT